MFSNTASMTMSASFEALRSVDGVNSARRFAMSSGVERAALHRHLVVLLDRRHAALERGLVVLDDRHRNADIGEVHRDAAAHRAGADHGRALDLARRDVLADARDLRGLALGEEDMALRLRLVADDQLHEEARALSSAPRRSAYRASAHRLDRGGGRMQAARLLGVLRDDLVELRRVRADLFELVLAILHARSAGASRRALSVRTRRRRQRDRPR